MMRMIAQSFVHDNWYYNIKAYNDYDDDDDPE